MEYNIDEIISSLDFKSSKLNNLSNGLVLTNNEIDVLNKYNIKYKSCSSLKEVLMLIDEKFNYEEVDNPDELDSVSASIAERDYYQNSNK
ncbi:MAG: hypothetical protein MR846_03225 [Tenericutes bacterium]|nr:hypothetical protein [Mycoplasmatota bacterium]MDD6263681.1 hypothetical protein [bacterium]MDD6941123.1 hypothetical protein [bacterium]MDY2697011.1 hypothetical protein [Bacilli bacterium]MDY5993597.1 hypothetical protein [Bacilli bacterium]